MNEYVVKIVGDRWIQILDTSITERLTGVFYRTYYTSYARDALLSALSDFKYPDFKVITVYRVRRALKKLFQVKNGIRSERLQRKNY